MSQTQSVPAGTHEGTALICVEKIDAGVTTGTKIKTSGFIVGRPFLHYGNPYFSCCEEGCIQVALFHTHSHEAL